MAQITPKESSQEEVAEDADAFRCLDRGRSRARGVGAVRHECRTTDAVFSASHDSLLRTAWGRRAVELELRTIHFKVEVQAGKHYFVFVDDNGAPTRVHGPPWSPLGQGGYERVGMLGWTKKMGCPTFDLPAGPPEVGGACPAARAGQSIMPAEQISRARRELEHASPWPQSVPGAGGNEVDRIINTVCQWCYATRQTYTYSSTQLAEIVAYSWAQQALRMPDGNSNVFVETMTGAIHNLFYTDGFDLAGRDGRPPEAAFAPDGAGGFRRCAPSDPERVNYFRIHSSGDFFSLDYMKAWAEVCRRFPKVLFWAPVRIWGMPAWQSKIDAMNIPPNMLMRPSAYYTNGFLPDPSSISKKFIAGTTVIHATQNQGQGDPRYDVNCPAYEKNNDGFTCRHSTAPEDGKPHCRTCWISPNTRVNYTLHG